MKPKILLVDDEDFSLVFMREFLGEQFEFDYAANGAAALVAVAAGSPALILMDVEMPGGMNGYQACRTIKDNQATQNIPVIFISAHTAAEDRLKAYQSGGDDYVSKPLNVKELRHKIELALANQEIRNELAEKARHANTVALMSIREAADVGAVLGFLIDIIRRTDLADIAATTLRTLHKFQMEGAVQLRDGRGHVSRNSAGVCTPVEDAVLAEMTGDSRIVDLGNRSAFNYERATVIIYSMPVQEPALYGRLKDTVVKMVEALDTHMRSLEVVTGALERGDALSGLLQRNAERSRDISTRIQAQRDENVRAMKHLSELAERAADAADAAAQKLLLQNLARDLQAQAQLAHAQCAELEKSLSTLSTVPVETPSKTTTDAPTADPSGTTARFNNVELF